VQTISTTSLLSALALTGVVLAACGGDSSSNANAQNPPPAASGSAASPPPSASAPPPAPPKAAKTWTGLNTPESVLVDGDRVFSSNINGKPLDVDNNGYIALLAEDGTMKKVIEGGKKFTLNAPKGMAIAGGVLYVADIDTVRTFDAKTFAHKSDIKIAKASFLNDVAAGPDGKIYVSDSGLKQGAKDFEGTGTDAVHVIEKGKAKLLAASAEYGRPNGLWVNDKGAVVVSCFGAAEIFTVGKEATKENVTKTPKGGLDGLAFAGGKILVSSWEGSAIYWGELGGKFELVIDGLKAPADIAYDAKRDWILVPRFLEDKVEAYEYDPKAHKLK
jgi:hypothetical protein